MRVAPPAVQAGAARAASRTRFPCSPVAAGKSSLLNAIVGEERSIVCDMSGTTRDAIDTRLTMEDGTVLTLIDTAGIRKHSKVLDSKDGTEGMSVQRALRAVRRAEVAVLVVDAAEGVTVQDFRLSEMFAGEGKAVVVVVNKWDKVDTRLWTVEKMEEEVKAQLRHVNWASVVCTTATKGKRVDDVVTAVLAAGKEHRRRVSTATLNMVVKEATQWKAPPTMRGSARKGKIYYATQGARAPGPCGLAHHATQVFAGSPVAGSSLACFSAVGLTRHHAITPSHRSAPTPCGVEPRPSRTPPVLRSAAAGRHLPPPSFVFFVNNPKLITDDYRKYMERALRDNIGFPGTPLRLLWRGKPEKEKGIVSIGGRLGAAAKAPPREGGGRGQGRREQGRHVPRRACGLNTIAWPVFWSRHLTAFMLLPVVRDRLKGWV
ncbi:MAG: hypothetical protein WDW36_003413 [Sanguina aurantia]